VPDIYEATRFGTTVWLILITGVRPITSDGAKCRTRFARANRKRFGKVGPTGGSKMFLTHRLLRFRNEHIDLFKRGSYLPIKASGAFADCCRQPCQRVGRHWMVVTAPRLSSRRLSADWREVGSYGGRSSGKSARRKCARRFHRTRIFMGRSTTETGGCDVELAVRSLGIGILPMNSRAGSGRH
jgi:hypothetical protein